MVSSFSFEIIKRSKKSWARAGVLKTPHGEIKTPAFAVIATQATVKSLAPEDLKDLGVQLVLANTYHLHLRPGEDIIAKACGLHKFMQWSGPMMTDSGGFQVFSLGWGREHNIGKIGFFPGRGGNDNVYEGPPRAFIDQKNDSGPKKQSRFVKIEEKGVSFRSHLDGSLQFLSPEKSIEIQQKLGADIIFAFDECTSPLAGYEYTKKATERTHRWAVRSLKSAQKSQIPSPKFQITKSKQMIFGIIQGGEYRDLREESARFISSLPFDGVAIGGALGKTKKDMLKILKWVMPILPEEKPRHLLGIGEPSDLARCVKLGIDIFDCVWPTRLARRGALLTKTGRINIKSAKYLKKFQSIEKECQCSTCQNFTLSYLCHLFRAEELLYHRLATIHNLYFTLNLIKKIRQRILEGRL